MFISHDQNSGDAYIRPSFSVRNKLKRVLWGAVWLLLCRWTPNALHKWRIAVLRLFGAEIGKTNFIYPSCKIWAPWLLKTEDIVTIASGVEIYNPGGLYLGHHSILSQDSYICGATHDYNSADFTYLKKKINIEPYVWICAKAVVLPGVRCFEGAVLGAAAVASKDLEPWTVYTGNPARAVKVRSNVVNITPVK